MKTETKYNSEDNGKSLKIPFVPQQDIYNTDFMLEIAKYKLFLMPNLETSWKKIASMDTALLM